MTRREKAQLLVLDEVHGRSDDQLGADAPSLDAIGEFSAETVRSIAAEMIEERLLAGEVEGSDEVPDAVRPHGLTERGAEYRSMLRRRYERASSV